VGSDIHKAYITLFTCTTTRTLHLELCTDMGMDKFLMALQRFVARLGIPTQSTQTMQEHSMLQTLSFLYCGSSYPPPKPISFSPIMESRGNLPPGGKDGGHYENDVCGRYWGGQDSLRNTTLVSTEAAVNSRPIAYGEDSAALTPAHLLIGLTTIPTGVEPTARQNLAKELRLKEKLSDDFWKRWTKEYLLELRKFHEFQHPIGKTAQLCLGDIIPIQEDIRPRHLWG
jgi:hypothetical protein